MKITVIDELADYVRSGQPVFYINTPEEARAIEAIRNTGWSLNCNPTLKESTKAAVEEILPKVEITRDVLLQEFVSRLTSDKPMDELLKIAEALNQLGYQTHTWDSIGGFNNSGNLAGDFSDAILELGREDCQFKNSSIIVFKDCDVFMTSATCRRALRSVYEENKLTTRDSPIHVVFLQTRFIPQENIRHCFVRLDFPLPAEPDISAIVNKTQLSLPAGFTKELGDGFRQNICRSLLGLDAANCEKALSLATSRFRGFVESRLMKENDELRPKSFISALRKMRSSQLSAGQGMRIFDPESPEIQDLGDLGAYENVQDLADSVRFASTEVATKLSIRAPSGMAIMGPPGTGKTQSAKLFAKWLGWPLIVVNLGTTKGGIVGESEANMLTNLETIRAIGQCVVLFDEFDKQSGGIINGASDGNTSANMLSLLLEYASDTRRRSFIIFTMNRLRGPIESIRAGRISRLFYTPLPTENQRRQIIEIKLFEYGADVPKKLEDVAADDVTGGMTGAELTELVNSAVAAAAQARGRKDPSITELIKAKSLITPVAKLDPLEMAEMDRIKNIAIPVGREPEVQKSIRKIRNG